MIHLSLFQMFHHLQYFSILYRISHNFFHNIVIIPIIDFQCNGYHHQELIFLHTQLKDFLHLLISLIKYLIFLIIYNFIKIKGLIRNFNILIILNFISSFPV
jgi:hypothetical protein